MSMPKNQQKPQVFVSYSHKDAELMNEFQTILNVMRIQGIIDRWTDAEIQPGDRWSDEIAEAMEKSQVIVFLVSNNFLASDYIRRVEAPKAMQMMEEGKVVIVPILLRDTPGWKREVWHCLQALPSDNKPITHSKWRDPHHAFSDVDRKLRELIDLLPDKLEQQRIRWEKRLRDAAAVGVPAAEDVPSVDLSNVETHAHPPARRGRRSPLVIASVVAVALLVAAVIRMGGTGETVPPPVPRESAFVPRDHTAANPYENSLGMKFVSLPGTDILCSIWELRVGDFKAFVRNENYVVPTRQLDTFEGHDWSANERTWNSPGFHQNDNHPVVGINILDARKFCEWLTKKGIAEKTLPEGYEYRVIRDEEWSLAAGDGLYPWNPYETPPSRRGNYGGLLLACDEEGDSKEAEHFSHTAPVGSFDPNSLGIHDLGGNVFDICDTQYSAKLNSPYLLAKYPAINHDRPGILTRGSGYNLTDIDGALTDHRWPIAEMSATSLFGFRVVLSPTDPAPIPDGGWETTTSFNFGGKENPRGNVTRRSNTGEFFDPYPGREFKDFEAEVRYRLKDVSATSHKAVYLGLGFQFRRSAIAPSGHRVLVSGLADSWIHGYYDHSGVWRNLSSPAHEISEGRVMADGSLNSMRLVVRGNHFTLFSNDCELGSREFDSASLAGKLTLISELHSENPEDEVTIEFESVRVRELE